MKNQRTQKAICISAFVVATFIVSLLMPHNKPIEPTYLIGKPWMFDDIVATKDFPIYKTEERLAADRAAILRDYSPYLNYDQKTAKSQIAEYARANRQNLSPRALDSLKLWIGEVYEIGIISTELQKELDADSINTVYVVRSNVSSEYEYGAIFTPATAYRYILDKATRSSVVDSAALDNTKITKNLKANLTLDQNKSSLAKKELLDMVSVANGVVRANEVIVSKGDIITEEIAQIISSYKKSNNDSIYSSSSHALLWSNIGSTLYVALLFTILFVYLYQFRSKYAFDLKMVLCMLLMLVGAVATFVVVKNQTASDYIVPLAILPLTIRLFFDSRTALYVHMTTVLMLTPLAKSPIEFAIIQIMGGMIAVSSLKDLNSRVQLIRSACAVFFTYALAYIAVKLSVGVHITDINASVFLVFAVNCVLILLSYGLIYLIEKLFGLTSGMTLIELSNINSPLLIEFSEKCPGTFQHVLQVSNLAVDVAQAIDANPLLTRAGALYHDIGKMANPLYFTENQSSGVNMLSSLKHTAAAQIIINHVDEGLQLAKKHKLPSQVTHFIATHHGTSKTKFFYNSYKNEHPGEEFDESIFEYKGPSPDSKETAIVMMTDAIEAASRSLKQYDENSINNLVDNIIDSQIKDGQFKNAPITFKEVEIAKAVFKSKLKNIYHSRITYPELKK